MKQPKILGTKYGITITRPWSDEMYAFNKQVADAMKETIVNAILNKDHTKESLNDLTRSVTGFIFGHGMTVEDMQEEMLEETAHLQNYWLAEEYPVLIAKGYCDPIKINGELVSIIGFDKK